MSQPEGVVVARIGKPHGLRGETTVQVHTDEPEVRFVPGATFGTDPAERGPLELVTVRVHQGVYLLAFVGHRDRDAAESLRGTRLLVTSDVAEDGAGGAEEGVVDKDVWRQEDLLGFTATLPDGTTIGQVSALHVRDVQDLLQVRTGDGREVLVPFVEELVPEIDEEAGRMVLDPPPGLLELGE